MFRSSADSRAEETPELGRFQRPGEPGSEETRTVTVKVSNRTLDLTLERPRIYLQRGRCSVPPDPEVPPGSSTCCQFSQDCSGVLLYRTKYWTLTVYFSNPLGDTEFPWELALELTRRERPQDPLPRRERHRGELEDVYERLSWADVVPTKENSLFDRIAPDTHLETAEVAVGNVRVLATMSNTRNAVVSLVVTGYA